MASQLSLEDRDGPSDDEDDAARRSARASSSLSFAEGDNDFEESATADLARGQGEDGVAGNGRGLQDEVKNGDGPKALFRMRIINLDSSLQPPGPFDIATTAFSTVGLERVPTIRLYGATPAGQRVCAHVHGVWPYCYVEYKGDLEPEVVQSYIIRLGYSLNHAMAVSLRRSNPHDLAKNQFVAAIILCKGIPFYGFHVGYSYYLKIYLTDPSQMFRLVTLLESGAIMKTVFQPHESHVPYLLQFFLDHNLFGCGMIDLEQFSFRGPLPMSDDIRDLLLNDNTISSQFHWTSHSTPAALIQDAHQVQKVSRCTLEIDFHAMHIINRHQVKPRHLHDDFHEYFNPPVKDEKMVHSVRELWADETRRRLQKGLPPTIPQGTGSGADDNRPPQPGEWAAETRLREAIERIVHQERLAGDGHVPKFETFAKARHSKWEKFIMTTFESTEALYPRSDIEPEEEQHSSQDAQPLERLSTPRNQPLQNGATATTPLSSSRRLLDPNRIDPYRLGQRSNESIARPHLGQSSSPLARHQKLDPRAVFEDVNDALIASQEMLHDIQLRKTEEERLQGPAEDDMADSLDYPEPPDLDLLNMEDQLDVNGDDAPREISAETNSLRSKSTDNYNDLFEFEFNPSEWELNSSLTSLDNEAHADAKMTTTPRTQRVRPANPFSGSSSRKARLEALSIDERMNLTPTRAPVKSHSPLKRGLQSGDEEDEYGQERMIKRVERVLHEKQNGSPKTEQTELNNADGDALEEHSDSGSQDGPLLNVPSPKALHFPEPDKVDHHEGFEPSASNPAEIDTVVKSDDLFGGDRLDEDMMCELMGDLTPTQVQSLSFEAAAQLPEATALEQILGTTSQTQAKDSRQSRLASSAIENSPSQEFLAHQFLARNTQLATQASTQGPSSLYRFHLEPPRAIDLFQSLEEFELDSKEYQDPYYSKAEDVPEKAREYAGREWKLFGKGIKYLKDFVHWPLDKDACIAPKRHACRSESTSWTWAEPPPSVQVARQWLYDSRKNEEDLERRHHKFVSQIEGPTQINHGFKHETLKSTAIVHEKQHVSVLAIEVFALARGRLLPNPEHDEVSGIFYCYQNEDEQIIDTGRKEGYHVGMILLQTDRIDFAAMGLSNFVFEVVELELDLINVFIDKVREWDPEVLVGYECQNSSWGYLVERARKKYDFDLCSEFSRVSASSQARRGPKDDRWGYTQTSTLKIVGRHVLNIWRMMRGELTLTSYSFENVAFHLLHRRVPKFKAQELTTWFGQGSPEQAYRVLDYYLDRVQMDCEMLDAAEVITRTAEFARVFGVDFFSVISRGSQFKVESMMFRIAKPESFVLLSPSRKQVGMQNAAECLPLIMEPQSEFYKGPLVVLDFQSLYPSVMIAYNLCYSTCLGRVGTFKGTKKFGVSELNLPKGLLDLLKSHITVAPNGYMYVKPRIRRSLLAKMLRELLDTRVMVKQGMKDSKRDAALLKLLNARQLGLKYIANVTYGYTSASFSGRMPCVEIADSIVQTGRETLEKAIEVIHSTKKWGAEVRYGDTDSLFVYLPGKTKDQAFDIGHEIAKTITDMNPRPIKLKFEKVYLPCVLLAKKRYVGFKYENRDDKEPAFDAKGIETVRRDGTPAGQKMLETSLKILFRTQNLSEVKSYCQRQWTKLFENRVSIQDFIFAKEVRLGTYSDKIPPPPGALIAAQRMGLDPRAEPQYGERVPYVVTQGSPGDRIIDQAVAPDILLQNWKHGRRLNAHYYVSRQFIPILSRVFNLIGADVSAWYEEMPKSTRLIRPDLFVSEPRNGIHENGVRKGQQGVKVSTIDQHFRSNHCSVCGRPTDRVICGDCRTNPPATTHALLSRQHLAEQRYRTIHHICASCQATPTVSPVSCVSLDCPIFYDRFKALNEAEALKGSGRVLEELWGSREEMS